MPGPTKRGSAPEPEAVGAKVSEMILEFAKPLLDAMGPSRDIAELRAAFELATVCWNLQVWEREEPAEASGHRQRFEGMIGSMPEPLSSALLGLIESRKTTFGQVPFMVLVEVRGTSLDDCTIYAEARASNHPI
jgi:hypothetical protein